MILRLIEKPETIIAAASLLVSVATFLFVYLRPAKVSVFLGPTVAIGYTGERTGLSVNLPVTFLNNGSKSGRVFRTAILFHHQDSLGKQYFIQWESFLKLDSQQATIRWVHEGVASVLMVPANSSVTRLILFPWQQNPPPEFREGIYVMEFLFWTDDSSLPCYETHQISISQDDVKRLNDAKLVTFQLDPQIAPNQIMNEFEARSVRSLRLKPKMERA